MARSRLVIESKYFPYLTNEEREYIGERIKDKSFYQYNRAICTVGILAEILKGRTAEEFVADLESRRNAFNNKYSCDKELSVRIDGDKLFIKFAYNEQLKNELKKSLSAKWHADSKEWSVSLADEVAANDIVKKHLSKGFLKVVPETEPTKTAKDEATETVKENFTVEDLKAKYEFIFRVSPSEISILLHNKFNDFIQCKVEGWNAIIYEFEEVALINFPDAIIPDNACFIALPSWQINNRYNKKALEILCDKSIKNRDLEISRLLEQYLKEIKKGWKNEQKI